MALPSDVSIRYSLMFLLAELPNGAMRCDDVYGAIGKTFPDLTYEEINVRYQHSRSHFANRVQWVVKQLRDEGLLHRPNGVAERGVWKLTEGGLAWLALQPNQEELMSELAQPAKSEA